VSVLGNRVLRTEDPRMLTEGARYVADLRLDGAAHACFVRSTVASGRLLGVDTTEARIRPGVLGVFIADDLDLPDLKPIPMVNQQMSRPVLVHDTVRFVGEPVAVVVADTPAAAADAAEHVLVDIEPPAAAVTLAHAAAGDTLAHPPAGFLETLRAVTADEAVLLLFDEVISLRLAMGGAQDRYGVVPDLTAPGKLNGGGLPVAAFGGRADIMAVTDPLGDMKVALAGTFNANPMTAAAGVAGLRLLTPEVQERIDRLGTLLREGLETVVEERGLPLRVEGGGSLLSVACEPGLAGSDFLMTGLPLAFGNRGVFGFPFLSTSSVMEEEHMEYVLNSAAAVFDQVAEAL